MKIQIPNIMLYAIVIVAFVGLVWLYSGMIKTQPTVIEAQPDTSRQAEFFQVEVDNDICATPVGYTDEEWIEHMGHHPERYPGCL